MSDIRINNGDEMNKYRKNPAAITLRITDEDREALRQKATASGMFLEEYCRFTLLGKRHSVPPKPRGRPSYRRLLAEGRA